jgi:putative acetyltransferase
VDVRNERPEDAVPVARLVTEAFGEQGPQVGRLVELLRTSVPEAARLSLVASDGGQIVGHVMFTRGFLDAPRRLVDVQVLSPLSVAAGHRRRGIGAGLVKRGVELVAERGVPAIFLEGDPRYYGRFGFTAAGPLGFGKPSPRIPDPAFQVLRTPAHEAWMAGALVYAEAFWVEDCVGLREAPG